MKRLSALVLCAICFSAYGEDCRICGKWKSEEQRTLNDIRENAPEMLEVDELDLENGFFGKLVVEYTPNYVTSYYPDDPENERTREKYVITNTNENVLDLKFPDREMFDEAEVHILDDCCFAILVGDTFFEYFCRYTN